jgi:hypothetical protein
MPELHAAIDRVVVGLERKTRLTNVKERRIVAFHESGHAIVAECSRELIPIPGLPSNDPFCEDAIVRRELKLLMTRAE